MPKLKTRKSVAKRVKISGGGKALRSKAGRRHLLSSKSRKRKRNLRQQPVVSAAEKKFIRAALPYA